MKGQKNDKRKIETIEKQKSSNTPTAYAANHLPGDLGNTDPIDGVVTGDQPLIANALV